jgi:ATP-dependent Clp protease ATP-binding subunit ClpC
MEQLKRTFRPEFLNRVDKVVVFRQLSQEDIRQIVDIILGEVNERLVEYDLSLTATDAAKNWMVEHGYDREFGARPLRRLIQSSIEDKLSDAVLGGRFVAGDRVMVDAEGDEVVLRKGNPSDEEPDDERTEEAIAPAV